MRQLTRRRGTVQQLWRCGLWLDINTAMLNIITHPAQTPATLPPLLIVHGLFGSARNWGVIARRMAMERDVFAVDMA